MPPVMFFVVLFVSVGVFTFNAEAGAPKCPSTNDDTSILLQDKDCSKYWRCLNGNADLLECPNGLYFNKKTNSCNSPHKALCSEDESSEELDSDEIEDILKYDNNIYRTCNTSEIHCPAEDDEQPVYFPLPNCTQFCQCSNGVPYLHDCPADLHFNPALNVCDNPQNAGCANGNSTDDSSTTSTESSGDDKNNSATTTEKGGPTIENDESYELCPDTVTNECPAVDGEHPVYIPLPNCSQFCHCSNGLPYLHNCPDDLHFNPVLKVCDRPEDAGCARGNDVISTTEGTGGDDNQPSPTTESSESNETDKATTTEKSATTTGSDESYELCHDTITNECPAVDGEHPVYIPLPNCSQFCQCSNGLPYLHNCPDDLHFNPVLNVCDWPGDAGCAGGNDVISTTEGTGGEDTQPSPTTESSEGNETDKATTEKSVTTTDSDESYELCPDTVTNECPAVDGEHPVYISLPNCSQFCQCSNGLPYLHNCPDDLHFNPVLNVCDWPGDAGCAGGNDVISTTEGTGGEDTQPSPTTESSEGNETDKATTEKSVTTTDSDESYELCPDTVTNECPAVDGEHPVYIPLPNCSQFCQCSNGLPYLHNCPDGLHFNPVLNVCDWPGDAGCAGGNDVISTTEGTGGDDNQPSPTTESSESNETDKATTTEKSATTTDSDESYELCPDTVTNECPEVDGEHPVYIPLPNCSQFCQCSNGLPYLHNCPDDLHFNPVLNVCDWPGDAGCAGGNDVISTTEGTGGEDTQPSPTTESSESNETDKATTTEKSAITTGSDESYELCHDTITNECPAVDGEHPVYIPLPNCSQFCQCSNGLPYLHNCPDGLHFNPVLNVCDWPGDAGCAGGNDVISTTEGTGGDDNQPSPTTESSESNETDKATTTEKSATTTDSDESYELCPDTVTNECPEVDGEHPVYIPLPNCSQFCQCSNGLPYLHNCPDDLHFNPVLNVCDWPGDAGCAGGNDVISTTEGTGEEDTQPSPTTESSESNETDKATTTEKSATTTGSDESYELCHDTITNECPAVDGEHPVYIPLPNCSQFCQCSNGLPYLHNCPGDLHFNPVLNVCDWPGDAGCAGGNDVISTTEGTGGDDNQPSPTTESSEGNETDKATTEKSETTTDSDESYELCPDTVTNECPAVDGEHPVYIPLPNCSQFCQCSNGLPYLHNCPDGLHFNPVLNVCDWPGDAGCAGGNDVISTTEGTGGDDNQPSPTTESSESNETDKATTTEKSATTTDSDESYELCPDTVTNECPEVDGEHPVYIPLPNCSQFCQCSNGLPYLHNCPDDLHFNPVLNVCDWPGDAGCAGGNDVISTTEGTGGEDTQPSPTTESSESNETDKATTTEKSATTTGSDESYELCHDTITNECPAVDGEHPVYIPLPNCSQFCQCSNGLPYLHNCPDGLHFNPVLNVCDWPGDAGCAGGNDVISTTEGTGGDDNQPSPTTESSESNETDKATTTEKSATTTDSDESYELCPDTVTNECPEVDGEHPVYIPLPNCSQFCQCSNGLPYLHNCPDDLHFNPVLNVCDWPGDAGCAGGNDVISTTEGTGGEDTQPSPTTESSESNETDKATTTEKSATTTGSDESYELCPDTVTNECPAVDGEHPVYISLPNCSQFCQCSNGLPYLHNCPGDLHFDPVLNVCDWPGDAGCAGGNDVISTTEGTGGDDNQPSPTTESSESNETDKATTTEKSATTTDSDESYELCPDTVTNECPEVDGEHPVYIPLPNCSQFCQCSNGLPYLHNCPDDLHFNPVLNVCDWPGDAGCAGGNDVISTTEGTGGEDTQPSPTTESSESNETDKATTTEKSATTTDSDESYELCPDTVTNECPEVDGEHPVYIPIPNCSQFCQCSNGLPYLHNCPDDLHFNPVLNVCDWPGDAGCAGGNDVISTTEGTGGEDTQPSPTTESSESNETDKATTTEKSATTTGSDESYELCHDTITNECPAVDGEHPVYIPLPNCSQFCQCSNGLPYLHNCPGDLHFNPVLNVCDWPGDAGCAGGNDVISTTEGTGGDDNQPSPTTESSEGNETDKATTEKSETTTDSDESYELCPDTVTNECPAVDGEHPVYIPLPNCSQFCQCSNGLPYLHNCPDGLHFNPVLNVCDWPGDAGCAGGNDVISTTEGTGGDDNQPSPTTESSESNETDKATTTEKSATTTDSDESYELCPDTVTNECPEVDGEHPVYIPLPNCSQFCQCSNGLPYLHNCPDDLHFNPVLNVCDWPGDAGCAGGNDVISTTEGTGGEDTQPSPTTESSESNETDKATTTEKSATTTDSDESYELCPDTVTNECPAVDGEHPVYIPLPNCSQFCQCSNGLPYLHNCPDGLHFNPVLNVCDWPGDAGCAGGNGVISTTEGTGGDDNQPSPTTESSESRETDKATTTEKSATTTDSDESYELCPDTVTNECPAVDGEHPVYIPLPNCSQFCQCSNGLPYLHNCPDGLHFNPVLNVCDWPGDAGCAGGYDVISTTEGTGGDDNQPSPTTESSESNETDKATTTEKSATTTDSDESYELCPDTVTNECPAVDGEHPVYIPLPNCSQFCQCSNGLPYLHNCPDDLHFNPVLNVCDWPEDAGCAGGNDVISTTEGTGGEDTQPSPTTDSSGGDESDFGTTTEDSVSTTVSEYMLCLDTVENKCPAVDGEHPVYIPLPNCTQFCQCSNGLPYLHYCPSDLHFNPVLNVCDYKENAGCASNNGTYSTLTTVDPGNKNTDASATTERSEDQETDRPVTTKSSTSTTESAETIELCPDTVENVCPPVDGEYPVYMPLPNCAQFCQCSNGLPYLHNCSDGLHFNALLNVCDYPQSAQCDSIPS